MDMMFGKKTGIPHEWISSTLGHGDLMCKKCMITSAEARVLGLVNDCQHEPATPSQEQGEG